ncbi:MAG TPA: zinc ribbon domain-containing protein [Pyrinomonadaceae bacterium]|nr:zinc ribbon domain-containing protein [Pyrinomonadaceae bacterium]
MSEPEIARRCVACGVSVRERAMFCPQCGRAIPEHQAATTNIAAADTMIDNAPPSTAAPVAVHRPTDHSVKARVEHIRKVSSVMIDQAAYDPSLRFLLVAAAFIILFLVLLIASKVIG